MPKTPHLWYAGEAEEVARFNASVFPDLRVERVTAQPADTPSGPAGSVKVVGLTLFCQPFMAISAGPLDPFNQGLDAGTEVPGLAIDLVDRI